MTHFSLNFALTFTAQSHKLNVGAENGATIFEKRICDVASPDKKGATAVRPLQRDRVEIAFAKECGLQPGCISEVRLARSIELVGCESVDSIELAETEVVEIAFRP
jgi:hypothetical protein